MNEEEIITRLSYANLYVSDVRRSVAFYERAFGLKLRFVHESGHYAEMETGATTLAFCQHELAESLHPGKYEKSLPCKAPLGAQISFEPVDVQSAYDAAVAAGAAAYSKPELMPWGWESAFVRDPDGFLVELCRKVG